MNTCHCDKHDRGRCSYPQELSCSETATGSLDGSSSTHLAQCKVYRAAGERGALPCLHRTHSPCQQRSSLPLYPASARMNIWWIRRNSNPRTSLSNEGPTFPTFGPDPDGAPDRIRTCKNLGAQPSSCANLHESQGHEGASDRIRTCRGLGSKPSSVYQFA